MGSDGHRPPELADEVGAMTVGSLFSGIGGFDLGLERAGHKILWQVEWDSYCQKVLAKHWPDVPCHGDIHEVGKNNLEKVDMICGGFPCQPVSVAGKQKGQDDERWLWPEFGRILCELRPRYAIMENVPGLLVRGMGDVLGDLSTFGYDAEWGIVSAASVGASHLRKRIFIIGTKQRRSVADTHNKGLRQCSRRSVSKSLQAYGEWPDHKRRDGDNDSDEVGKPSILREDAEEVADAISDSKRRTHRDRGWRGVGRRQEQNISEGRQIRGNAPDSGGQWATEPDVGRVAYGVPNRVHRLRGLGNAIVPQVAEYIGRRVQQMENADQ